MMTQINVRHTPTEKCTEAVSSRHNSCNISGKEASLSVWLSVIPLGWLKNTLHGISFVAGENEGLVKTIFAIGRIYAFEILKRIVKEWWLQVGRKIGAF